MAFAAMLRIGRIWVCLWRRRGADISGTYWPPNINAKLQIVGGAICRQCGRQEGLRHECCRLKDGSITDAARKFCVPDGIPRRWHAVPV